MLRSAGRSNRGASRVVLLTSAAEAVPSEFAPRPTASAACPGSATASGRGGARRARRWLGRLAAAVFVLASWCPGRTTEASTVAEQRARLPPPAECTDPVAGIWKSHSYDFVHYDWTVFTLDIKRVEPGVDRFTGTITNHSWEASEAQSSPPPCTGALRYVVSMDAEGKVESGVIDFYGVGTWRLDDVPCGYWDMDYNLDHFTGKIDPELYEFQSVNNDGGRSINDPVVFRRVKCHDGQDVEGQADEPRIAVAPPPFYPPEDEGAGCGFR